MTVVAEKRINPVAKMREELHDMSGQFEAALPAHIPVERFMRIVMTSAQQNPELLECDRRSFWNAAMKAAQDGLLPDGREGAMVVRVDRKNRTKAVSWQPMVAGIRKKARNSGEISDWNAYVVRANDFFQFQLGDNPQINHSFDITKERGAIVAAYSVARLKDGTMSREVMPISEIHRIRDQYSESWKAYKAGYIKTTPWLTAEDEMCRKTVARRHSKVLPMSTDLDDLIRRDDELYQFEEAKREAGPRTLADKFDVLAKSIESKTDASPNASEDAGDESEPLTSPASDTIAEDDASDGRAPDASKAAEGEGSPPSAAEETQAAKASELDLLLDAARAKALDGSKALDRWIYRLRPDQYDTLQPHMIALQKAAREVDQNDAAKKLAK